MIDHNIKPDERQPRLLATLKSGLSGRCFILLDETGATKYQGIVHSVIPASGGDLVLVQYFEALMGEPNTMALVHLADMVKKRQEKSGYVFFEDDDHLRYYMENVQRHRDKHIWEQTRQS